MRILMCLESDFFSDHGRVGKESRALADAGHKVFVLSLDKGTSPPEEDLGYATALRRIPVQSLAKKALRYLRLSIRGLDPLWYGHIARAVREYDADVIHVHDLPLINTGLKVARRKGIPVVADLHENYPEAIGVSIGGWRGVIANMLISPARWKRFEKSWVTRADRVITVVDEIGRHLIDDCGVREDKLTVVMNAPDLDYFCSLPIEEDIVDRYEPYFAISYVGGFGRHRGIQSVIAAMPAIVSEIPGAHLILVGGRGIDQELRDLAHKSGCDEAIDFTGWLPFHLLPSYIAASHVCLMPYGTGGQTNLAPNKLFQYWAMGKPVIAAGVGSLTRIIDETGAGLVYPAGDAAALAQAVIRLYKDKKLADRLGKAGLSAVRTKYNWEIEGKKLVDLYRSLEK